MVLLFQLKTFLWPRGSRTRPSPTMSPRPSLPPPTPSLIRPGTFPSLVPLHVSLLVSVHHIQLWVTISDKTKNCPFSTCPLSCLSTCLCPPPPPIRPFPSTPSLVRPSTSLYVLSLVPNPDYVPAFILNPVHIIVPVIVPVDVPVRGSLYVAMYGGVTYNWLEEILYLSSKSTLSIHYHPPETFL